MSKVLELELKISEDDRLPDFFELDDDIEVYSRYRDREKHKESKRIFAEVLDPRNKDYSDMSMFKRFQMLMIMFLKGEIYSNPFHLAPVDRETIPLLKTLIRINEAGFVTIEGQPGECGFERINKKHITDKRLDKVKKLKPFENYGRFVEEEQRAYMAGFICDPQLISKLEKNLEHCAVFSVKMSEPPSSTRVRVFGDVQKYMKDGRLGLTRSRFAGEPFDDYDSALDPVDLEKGDFVSELSYLNEKLENPDDSSKTLYSYLKNNCYYVFIVKLKKCRKLDVEVFRALKMR